MKKYVVGNRANAAYIVALVAEWRALSYQKRNQTEIKLNDDWEQICDDHGSYRIVFLHKPSSVVYKIVRRLEDDILTMQRREVLLFNYIRTVHGRRWAPLMTQWTVGDDELVNAAPYYESSHAYDLSPAGKRDLREAERIFDDLRASGGNYKVMEDGRMVVMDGGNANYVFQWVESELTVAMKMKLDDALGQFELAR
jgi:hypothetical protein